MLVTRATSIQGLTGNHVAYAICSLDAHRTAMSLFPTVLYPLTLAGLLHHVLTTQSGTAATTLIICSSRDVFLQHLAQSLQQDQGDYSHGRVQDIACPSLRNLLIMRHVKLAFCASVQALLAYLTAYGRDASANTDGPQDKTRMFLVNPLALHASTLSFSAQGLSRSFAAVTETALKVGAVLHVVECRTAGRPSEQQDEADDLGLRNVDEDQVTTAEQEEEKEEQDPWEQEVSILNVSARRFGSNSEERAWAGRTVKAKRVAARWFHFAKLGNTQASEDQSHDTQMHN
jgi:hypothetical protein